MTLDTAKDAGHHFTELSKDDLIRKLLESEQHVVRLREQAVLDQQRAAAEEQNWAKIEKRLWEQQEKLKYLGRVNKELEDRNATLKEKLRKAWSEGHQAGLKKATNYLEEVFSPAQIKALTTKKRVNWSPDDLSSAVALYSCSPKAYKYMRDTMKIPLPSRATLHRWAAKTKVSPGIQTKVLLILEKLGKMMPERERLVVISFDEMHISQRVQYDQSRDAVVGPHSQVQVVFIRSLLGEWKQPIYFAFDENMTKKVKH